MVFEHTESSFRLVSKVVNSEKCPRNNISEAVMRFYRDLKYYLNVSLGHGLVLQE